MLRAEYGKSNSKIANSRKAIEMKYVAMTLPYYCHADALYADFTECRCAAYGKWLIHAKIEA